PRTKDQGPRTKMRGLVLRGISPSSACRIGGALLQGGPARTPPGVRVGRDLQGCSKGLSVRPPSMKNFARLVRFAWPYRVRFGLSLGCAAMVALLWFTELGAVYPLLQILFNSQNCQRWVAEKIDAIATEIEALQAQLDELDTV